MMAANLVRTILFSADAIILDEMIRRRRDLIASTLRWKIPPVNLVRAVLDSGDSELALVLASSSSFPRCFPAEAAALAATGDPLTGSALLRHAIPELRTAVLADGTYARRDQPVR